MSTAELERLMNCHKLLDSPLTQARTPSTVAKMISIYKDCPDPDQFDFPLAILIWKHIEAVKSGRIVTVASPFRRFVHFPNPSPLPTPGYITVTSFQEKKRKTS